MDEIFTLDPERVSALHDAIQSGHAVSGPSFASLTGTPEPAVRKALKAGILPTTAEGLIPVPEGVVALVSAGGLRQSAAIPAFLLAADATARAALGLPARDVTPRVDADEEYKQWKLRLLKAQTAAKIQHGKRLTAENEEAAGQLVRRAEVELDAAETATNVIRVLNQIPARCAGLCVGQSAERITQIIRGEIASAIDAIQQSLFTGDWGGIV